MWGRIIVDDEECAGVLLEKHSIESTLAAIPTTIHQAYLIYSNLTLEFRWTSTGPECVDTNIPYRFCRDGGGFDEWWTGTMLFKNRSDGIGGLYCRRDRSPKEKKAFDKKRNNPPLAHEAEPERPDDSTEKWIDLHFEDSNLGPKHLRFNLRPDEHLHVDGINLTDNIPDLGSWKRRCAKPWRCELKNGVGFLDWKDGEIWKLTPPQSSEGIPFWDRRPDQISVSPHNRKVQRPINVVLFYRVTAQKQELIDNHFVDVPCRVFGYQPCEMIICSDSQADDGKIKPALPAKAPCSVCKWYHDDAITMFRASPEAAPYLFPEGTPAQTILKSTHLAMQDDKRVYMKVGDLDWNTGEVYEAFRRREDDAYAKLINRPMPKCLRIKEPVHELSKSVEAKAVSEIRLKNVRKKPCRRRN